MTFGLARPGPAADLARSITQFTHTAWSAKDGIPGPVRAIAQTPDGFLWLGTDAGLYRFDGLRFEASHDLDRQGMGILSLLAARDGSLWIGFASGGVNRFRDGKVTSFAPGTSVPPGTILSLAEDDDGSIWLAGQYGLARFQNGEWRRIGVDMGYPAPAAQSLLVDRSGTLWVATDAFDFGLTADPIRRNTILSLARGATRFSATGEAVGMIWSMGRAPDGSVWAADTSANKARRLGLGDEAVVVDGEAMCVMFANDGSAWIGLQDGGLRRARKGAGDAPPERYPAGQLSGALVYAAFKDREGNLWFGTNGGLDRFGESKVVAFSEIEGLPPSPMALAATADGSIWLFGYTSDTVYRFLNGTFTPTKLPRFSRSDSTRILAIHANAAGEVWLGGSFKLARGSHGTFTYVDVPDPAPPSTVEAVAQDKAGQLWITMTGNKKIGQILRRRGTEWADVRAQWHLPPYRCRVLHPDAAGRMWMGFENGEVAVADGETYRVYSSGDGLPTFKVLTIFDDREGQLWIGGETGLSLLDHDHFVTLTQMNGLPGTSISGIVEDDSGNLWVAGALGLLGAPRAEWLKAAASGSYRIQGFAFDASDGLRGLPRQRTPFPTAVRAADGRLWFATNGGVAVIDPHRWPKNALPPPVKIERAIADDRVQEASGPLTLPPNTRRLEIRFAALSLTAPERVLFRYRLEGYDPDWRGPVNTRTATYTNLPPKQYRFRVIAANNDGVWNNEGADFQFSIAPAFYQTRLFLLLCVAAAASAVWAAIQWRMRQMRTRLQLQFEERLAERTRIAQELHDTLLQGFLSASMQLHVAVERVPPESPDKPRLQRVLELMRAVIEEGRNAVKGLRSSKATDDGLEEAFSRIPKELDAADGIDFRVIGEGHARPLNAVIRDEVYRIGREALVNAFRHSGAKRIEVEVEFAKKALTVAVRDDGRGIDPAVLESGREGHWGLIGMRERARRIGAQFKLSSALAAGTEVELSVPGRVAYSAGIERES